MSKTRFVVEPGTLNVPGLTLDRFVDLRDTRAGVLARLGNMGPSLRRLLLNYGTPDQPHLMNTVFCAEDWAAKIRGLSRLEDPREYTRQIQNVAHELRLKGATLTEGGTLDIANRTAGGKARCYDPDTGVIYGDRDFGINHAASQAHLHGPAQYTWWQPYGMSATDECASVSYCVTIGQDLPGAYEYFGTVKAYIIFTLYDNMLIEEGIIKNEGNHHAPIAFGRHGSYRVGPEGLDKHVLRMDVRGALDVDAGFNPNGKILTFNDTIFQYGRKEGNLVEVSLDPKRNQIDTTFLLGSSKDVIVYNQEKEAGMIIGAEDDDTEHCTIWNNVLKPPVQELQFDHVAVEHLVGGHAASLSYPLKEGLSQLDELALLAKIPEELRQLVLAPGGEVKYKRTYKMYKPG